MNLREILILTKKDICSGIYSPILLSISATYVFVTGFFFFTYLKIFSPFQKIMAMSEKVSSNLNTAVIEPTYQANLVFLLFLIPILSTRMFSEEREAGTFEYLCSLPVKNSSIAISKWLSSLFFIWCTILLGLTFPLTLLIISDPEIMPTLIGASSLLLISSTLVAVAIFFSSLSTSSLMSAVFCLVTFLIWFIIDSPFSSFGGEISSFFRELSLSVHSSVLLNGLLSVKEVYFFILITLLTLYFAVERIKSLRKC